MTIQRLEVGTLNVAPALRAQIARTLRVSVAELWPDGDGIGAVRNGGAQ